MPARPETVPVEEFHSKGKHHPDLSTSDFRRPFFPCSAHRANVRITRSTGGTVPPSIPPRPRSAAAPSPCRPPGRGGDAYDGNALRVVPNRLSAKRTVFPRHGCLRPVRGRRLLVDQSHQWESANAASRRPMAAFHAWRLDERTAGVRDGAWTFAGELPWRGR